MTNLAAVILNGTFFFQSAKRTILPAGSSGPQQPDKVPQQEFLGYATQIFPAESPQWTNTGPTRLNRRRFFTYPNRRTPSPIQQQQQQQQQLLGTQLSVFRTE